MRISFWLPIFTIFSGLQYYTLPVYTQCLDDQRSLLLAFRKNLVYDSSSSTLIAGWNPTTDCCEWGGITCDSDGRVIGLDLNNQTISGVVNDSSSLFHLRFLRSLNLAYNPFESGLLPSEFGQLTHLTYLNLSNANFVGQVPVEFSLLTSLFTLDLSSGSVYTLDLQSPDLRVLVQNLTQLRQLYLDNMNIGGYHWSRVISSFLPHLQVLSLKNCNLSGPLESSLAAKVQHLSVILLDGNTFSSEIPESFADLRNLTVFSLQRCNLSGKFPKKIIQVSTLKTIDLSNNVKLEGPLPEMGAFELQNLVLSDTWVGGKLPDSIGSLHMLSRIELGNCGFQGPIPDSIQNLTLVQYLDLAANHFTGSVPSFQLSKKHLVWVNFYKNNLTGGILSSQWEGLDKLEYLCLASNSLSGSFPESLLTLKSLRSLYLYNNSFSGKIINVSSPPSSQLFELDPSNNNFEGPIPEIIFKLTAISTLTLSSNKFSGEVDLLMFGKLKELSSLDLSYNNLTVSVVNEAVDSGGFSNKLNTLKLASCKMRQQIPVVLKNQSGLMMLDLSDNQISGEIPNWIWELGNGFLRYLNLSHNKFSSLQKPYTFPFLLDVLDLHSNHLEGDIPVPPKRVYILDYSTNNFTSSIPVDFGNFLTSTFFFSISNNQLEGPIPHSICNASNNLAVLDLSNNRLNGTLPSCLADITTTLRVLNLRGNKLTGHVLDAFPETCNLQTLDLSNNRLQGSLPQSLVRCKNLAVLDLGHNNIVDHFPCWLNNLSNLHVFVIRSNRFHGNITCLRGNSLQIIDIASNEFSGVLPPALFASFQGIIGDNDTQSKLGAYLYFEHPAVSWIYYQDSVTVVLKGTSRELEKILSIFTSIDFSNNKFQGSIPATVGDLKLLKLVNLSHNALTGPVPMSTGKLINLESLDLSVNKLSGSIPPQLASLSFLSFLNLSYNELSGRIPLGSQFQTFTALSFEGNKGLCGMPLNKSCNIHATSPELEENDDDDNDDVYISMGLGFVVGFVMIVWPLVFFRRWATWYNNHVDKLLSTMAKRKEEKGKAKQISFLD